MAKVRTIPRCEAEVESGLAGVDGLPGDEHTHHCSTPATRVLRVWDEVAQNVLGDGEDTWVLCDEHRDLLLQDAAVGPFELRVLSDTPIPAQA